MRYAMKQKLFALGSDFVIKDEAGNDRFLVDGKAMSLGDKLSFQDMQGNELALIRQKLLSFSNTYEIYHGSKLFAVVTEGWLTILSYRFTVNVSDDGPPPYDLDIRGDFSSHEYTFFRDEKPVASVSRAWFAMTDTYGVDIAQGQDDALILACTVVVDMVTMKHKKE